MKTEWNDVTDDFLGLSEDDLISMSVSYRSHAIEMALLDGIDDCISGSSEDMHREDVVLTKPLLLN